MVKQLKSNFFQTFSITFIWILGLISMFLKNLTFTLPYIWNLIGISTIFAIIFGLMYPILWNFSSMKVLGKIIISSVINISGGIASVWLFSTNMFEIIKPWIFIMLIITILAHIIVFYFYSNWENQKTSNELNKLLKK
jgi:predicted neutral ceramidase superfamily lipid hydrolase